MKPLKFLAYSDPHVPIIDGDAEEWVIKKIIEHRPDVIILVGDLFEADSASRWPSESSWTLSDEFKAAEEHLKKIRKARPEAKRVFVEGNHDANIKAINRIDSKLRGLVDYERQGNCNELTQHWRIGARYKYDRSGCYRIGQVAFSHGYESGANGDELESVYMACEYGLLVRGHSHRPVQVTQALKTKSLPLRYWYANCGTIGKIEREYIERKRHMMWGAAVVVGEAQQIKSPRSRQCWAAHTEFMKKIC